jgi:hypothetical protein
MRTPSIGIRLGSAVALALGLLVACGGSGGDSGGGGTVLASSFDQSCSKASDCVPVYSGAVVCCGGACDGAAINKSDEAKYEAAVMAARAQLDCTGVPCSDIACAIPTATCESGKCVVLPFGSDAGSDSGFDAGRVACGKTTCAPGEVCVSSQIEGGALRPPNDAGVCPDGEVLSGASCEAAPTFACAKPPSSCATGLSCACAQSLCEASHMCTEAKDGLVQCVEEVP